MSQIVKRKKKGRPSKADLARRMSESAADGGYELRRSLRRRNVRYNFDIDDYLDDMVEEMEEEEEEEDDEERREKKLKLVLKLNQSRASADPPPRGRPRARGRHVTDEDEEEEQEGEEDEEVAEEEEEEEEKPVKKRRISGGGSGGDEEDKDYEDVEVDEDDQERRKVDEKTSDPAPGTPGDQRSETPMPDKKSLELILDKLQKKDIYGVYAEPVDPEELPDYHEIIEHPMDFATVRKKLANGSYSTLEEFESDIFLICSNAMLYNSPDTVYYKQARTIQEMAKKKFEKIRIKIERSEKEQKSEQKSEQKVKLSVSAKKQMKQPISRTTLEPVGSDFFSGANLATGGAIQNGSIATQTGGQEKHNHADGLEEGNTSLFDISEKAEEPSSGKGPLNKFGKKLSAVEENRRATYNISNQPADRSESIFTTFESEIKQLVAVGLHAEHAYARSLARFAATLGPIAWKVASQRIEQALPTGFKFGHGWVGEYEPLPTPVLMLETHRHKEPFPFWKSIVDKRNDEMPLKTPVSVKEQPAGGSISEGKSCLFRTSIGAISEGKPSFVASPGAKSNAIGRKQNPFSRTCVEPQNKVMQQVELNMSPSANQNNSVLGSETQSLDKSEMIASRSGDTVARSMKIVHSVQLKPLANSAAGLPNGKVTSCSNSRMIGLSSDSAPSHVASAATFLPHGQDQGLCDPVQLMRSLTEKAKMQQNSSGQPQVDASSVVSSVPAMRVDDSNNAAVAAARAWMSIGAAGFKQPTENSSSPKNQISAASLYNPARELHPQVMKARAEFPPAGMQFQPERNSFPFQGFAPQAVRALNGAQFQNRPMAFPQLVTADFSRFQVQSPWRGITPHVQLKQKQDNLPPDLNIGVQSPDSPAKQSSGVRVDSQQPDLALQL